MSDDMSKRNDILKEVFRQLHDRIVYHANTSFINDKLFAESVIGVNDLQELNLIRDRFERCRQLLIILSESQNPTAFILLRLALKKEDANRWLVDKIDRRYDQMMSRLRRDRETSIPSNNQELKATGGAVTSHRASVALEHLQTIFKCSQCREVNDEPIVLPCYHKLCRKCLNDYTPNKLKPDELVCPICDTKLKLPGGCLAGLPKNHFIERWKVTKELLETRVDQKLCDWCTDDKSEPKKMTAEVFCSGCSERLCRDCYNSHKRVPKFKNHKTFSLDNDGGEWCEMAAEQTAPHCEKHAMLCLSHYCFDCKLVTCESCIEEQHQQHACVDVHEAIKRITGELESQSKDVRDCVAKCQRLMIDVSQYKQEVERQISDAATAIELRATEQKMEIDRQKMELLKSLDVIKTKRIEETLEVNDQIKKHESLVETFLSYVAELRRHGNGIETACQISGLQDSASGLLKLMDSIGNSIAKLCSKEVKFRAVAVNHSNLIGELNSQRSVEAEVHVIQTTVDAVTSINDEIFVMRRPSHQQLDVFNAMTKTFKRKLHIKDFSDDTTFSCGLTSCTDDNCLYVCDSLRRYIHRLDLSNVTPEEPTSWQVEADEDDAVTSLSMNSTREVLVTCSKTHRILTYSKLGKLMHEIRLDQTEVTRPQHAIQLQDDRFIVSHSGPVYGVSVVNKHGKVELTYRNESVEKK